MPSFACANARPAPSPLSQVAERSSARLLRNGEVLASSATIHCGSQAHVTVCGMRNSIATLALLILAEPSQGRPSSPWPTVREFGGATPLRADTWVRFTDYPPDALSRMEQGNVIVKFDIDVEGRPRNCTLDTSSGHPRLDAIPCRLIEKRARFKPATDANGTSMPTAGRYSVAFWLPD